MSQKHVRTVADLVRFGCALKIECGNCGTARTSTGSKRKGLRDRLSLRNARSAQMLAVRSQGSADNAAVAALAALTHSSVGLLILLQALDVSFDLPRHAKQRLLRSIVVHCRCQAAAMPRSKKRIGDH